MAAEHGISGGASRRRGQTFSAGRSRGGGDTGGQAGLRIHRRQAWMDSDHGKPG